MINEKRKELYHGVLLQYGNVRPHVSSKTLAAIHELGCVCLTHPPYSPDLAPSDYRLFEEIKRPLLTNKKVGKGT